MPRPARPGSCTLLTIDGVIGEGGGQILRSALALSLCSGRAFRMVNIRARRRLPGLRPQHLAAVRAAAEVSGAEVAGAVPDGRELTFVPGSVAPGEYRFATGTAGSTTLVLQTVLPALMTASAASRLELEGGTHNPQAPTFDFLARAYVPLINRMGPRVRLELRRAGFYPRGGGLVGVEVQPARRLRSLELHDRGRLVRASAVVLLSRLPAHIAEREAAVLRAGLDLGPDAVTRRVLDDAFGPGNVVTVVVECEHVVEVFTAFGRRGTPAEEVAEEAVAQAHAYLDAAVPIGPHLADQLLLPLALAGSGGFVTTAPTAHATTNARVIERFLPVRLEIARAADATWAVRVCGRPAAPRAATAPGSGLPDEGDR